jgi:hypothetical protein
LKRSISAKQEQPAGALATKWSPKDDRRVDARSLSRLEFEKLPLGVKAPVDIALPGFDKAKLTSFSLPAKMLILPGWIPPDVGIKDVLFALVLDAGDRRPGHVLLVAAGEWLVVQEGFN